MTQSNQFPEIQKLQNRTLIPCGIQQKQSTDEEGVIRDYYEYTLIKKPLNLPVDIKNIKTAVCEAINAKRDEMQSKPLEYTFPDGAGHIQRRGQEDERNIQGVASAALALVLAKNTKDKVHFTDEENIKHYMKGKEGIEFGLIVQQNYAANQDNARQHKDVVNTLTTIEDITKYDYSTGWV